jgi:hypothetical protein
MKIPDWLNPWKQTKNTAKEIAEDLQERIGVVTVGTLEKVDQLLNKHTHDLNRQLNELLNKLLLSMLIIAILFLAGLFGVLKYA